MNETATSPFDSPAIPVPVPPGRVFFTGPRSQFSRLVIRGAALELVTVGFYRFWLATDIRRFLSFFVICTVTFILCAP